MISKAYGLNCMEFYDKKTQCFLSKSTVVYKNVWWYDIKKKDYSTICIKYSSAFGYFLPMCSTIALFEY